MVVKFHGEGQGEGRSVVPSNCIRDAASSGEDGYMLEAFWYDDDKKYMKRLRAGKEPDESKGRYLLCKQVVNESKYDEKHIDKSRF